MYTSILINIDEIWLKGGNRRWYIDSLKNNLRHSLRAWHSGGFELQQEGPKFYVTSVTEFSRDTVKALTRVAGVQSLQPCRSCAVDLDDIKRVALEEVQKIDYTGKTFRVETKRTNKKFPMDSMKTSREVGAHILINTEDLKAKMQGQDFTVSVRILNHLAFVATETIPGISGVPVGTGGKAVVMLSGGFDSPVASYMMFRRGLQQTYAFFHPYPYVGNEVLDKIRRLVKVLSTYQNNTRLWIMPFGEIQKKIADHCKPDYRTLLFRNLMIQTSEAVAAEVGAKTIITGDSLSQVSSQTLENLSITDRVANIPVLRPLIGMNKGEIILRAKEAGTHDISIEAQDDACSQFAPKHPIIRGQQDYIDEFSRAISFDSEIERCVRQARVESFDITGTEKMKTEYNPNLNLDDL